MISCVSNEMYTARLGADPGFQTGVRFEDNMERKPIMGVWGLCLKQWLKYKFGGPETLKKIGAQL